MKKSKSISWKELGDKCTEALDKLAERDSKTIKLDSHGSTTEIELTPTLTLALNIINNAEGVSQQVYDDISREIKGNWFDLIELTALNSEYRDRLINLGEKP